MRLITKWTVDPSKFLNKVEKDLKKKTIELAEKIFDEVVSRTPVNTGRARACWTLTEGAPKFVSIPGGLNYSSPLDPPDRPNLSNINSFTKLFVSNGQPYIVKLEYGYSNQAPSGMVRIALAGLT
mgnify:CR=1 FL=1